MNWRYFVGASILAGGLLLKTNAPWLAILLGITLAGFVTLRGDRASRDRSPR